MNKLIGTIGIVLSVASAAASASEGIYLGPSISGYYLDSDRVISGHDEAIVAGVNLGYRFFNDWALEAGVGRDIGGDDLDVAKIDFLYWPGENRQGWRPYLVASLSYFDRDEQANLQPEEENTHQFGGGVGLSKMLSDNWEFRSDLRLMHKVREGQDGTNDGVINFALNYYFNPPAAEPVVEQAAPEPAPEPEAPEPEPEVRSITIRLNVEFEFDKAVVRAIYGDELQAVANAMKVQDDIELVLEGHTDSRGSDEYNQSLSARRARAVMEKLVSDYGIDPSRVTAVGYGESRPIDTNDTDEGRARNRRVVGEMSYSEVISD